MVGVLNNVLEVVLGWVNVDFVVVSRLMGLGIRLLGVLGILFLESVMIWGLVIKLKLRVVVVVVMIVLIKY